MPGNLTRSSATRSNSLRKQFASLTHPHDDRTVPPQEDRAPRPCEGCRSFQASTNAGNGLRAGYERGRACVGFRVTFSGQGIPSSISLPVSIKTADHLIQEASPVLCRQLQYLLRKKFDWYGQAPSPEPGFVACHILPSPSGVKMRIDAYREANRRAVACGGRARMK